MLPPKILDAHNPTSTQSSGNVVTGAASCLNIGGALSAVHTFVIGTPGRTGSASSTIEHPNRFKMVSQAITFDDFSLSHSVPRSAPVALSLDRNNIDFPFQRCVFGPARTRGDSCSESILP